MRFLIDFSQATDQEQITYTIYALDTSLGYIGGITALFWSLLGCCVGNFQEFNYTNHLAGELYTREKHERSADEKVENSDLNEVGACVLNREPHKYLYGDYLADLLFLSCLCKCLHKKDYVRKRRERYKMHDKITEHLNDELDIVKTIRWNRAL